MQEKSIRISGAANLTIAELRTQLYIGIDIGYIGADTGKVRINETRALFAMLVGLSNKQSS